MTTAELETLATSKDVEYYRFDYGSLPDDLFSADTPLEAWFGSAGFPSDDAKGKDLANVATNCTVTNTTAGKQGFPANSLRTLDDIPWQVECERIIGIAAWMAGNVLPFVLPGLAVAAFALPSQWNLAVALRYLFYFVAIYATLLFAIEWLCFHPYFRKAYKLDRMPDNVTNNQYVFTERNTAKYFSTKYVWPKSIHYPALKNRTAIFCIVPHGVVPFGVTGYPMWSKAWNKRLCHWTCAPVLLKIPIVGKMLSTIGYIPAKSGPIIDVLTKKEENVGIILDGIAGMFHTPSSSDNDDDDVIEESAYLKARKGVVKIALKAGVPIIPVYGFGHTATYSIWVDPFGILRRLSIATDTSITPFFGRWGWFLGPPRRVPLAVCLGNPVNCPRTAEPTQKDIDEYHSRMVAEFQNVFETHKAAYGWSNRKLKIV